MRSLLIVLFLSSPAFAAWGDCPLLPRNWPRNQPPTVIVQPPQPNTIYFFPYYYYPQQQYYYPQQNYYYQAPQVPNVNIQPGRIQVQPAGTAPCPDCTTIQLEMNQESNRYRQRFGRSPCKADPILMKTAQEHAERMARFNRMSHNLGGSPGSRARANGFSSGASENIAMGSSTVASTFSMWYRSGGHRRNMLGSSWNVAGFGHAVSRNGRHYWAAMYGRT